MVLPTVQHLGALRTELKLTAVSPLFPGAPDTRLCTKVNLNTPRDMFILIKPISLAQEGTGDILTSKRHCNEPRTALSTFRRQSSTKDRLQPGKGQ